MITKERLQHQIDRTKKKIAALEEREDHLSKYGYIDLGYFKGRLTVLEDWLDEMTESEEQK